MSLTSFFSARSDLSDRKQSLNNGKGRFKVVHIDETDDENEMSTSSFDRIRRENDLISSEKMIENEISDEKGASFLRNLYDYKGGTFMPSIDDISNGNSNNAQLKTLFGVFLPCVQNIIGVIVFIRLYWLVGVSGIVEGTIIIGLCCLCTFLTSISLGAG